EARTDRHPAGPENGTGRQCRPVRHAPGWRRGQAAASLSFLSGRTFTFTEAGLAANHCSSLVNGLMPLRRGLAGTLTAVNLATPGSVKLPAPFLLSEPWMAPSSAPSTARMSFAATSVALAMWATRPDLVSGSLIAFGAAGLAAFFGAAFLVVAFFFAMGFVFPRQCLWSAYCRGRTSPAGAM